MYSKAVIFISSFSFANKTAQIYYRDLLCFILPVFPLYPCWLKLAAALPVPWRKSCKASDASMGSIHRRKMSNNVLRKCYCSLLFRVQRVGGREVCQFFSFKCHSCLCHVRWNIIEIRLVWVNGATSASKYFFPLYSEVIEKSGQSDEKSNCFYALYSTHTHTHSHSM